jgi:hypothetical protein
VCAHEGLNKIEGIADMMVLIPGVGSSYPLRTGLNRGRERLILIDTCKDDEAGPQLAQTVQ